MRQQMVIIKIIAPILIVLTLTGCPWVHFYVEPETVTFGETSVRETVRIVFSQSGNWSWEAEASDIWLKLSNDGGVTTASKIKGTLSGGKVQQLDLIADRSSISDGTSLGEVIIKSVGDTKKITVSITKPGTVNISVSPLSLNFGTVATELEANIVNQSTIKTNWRVTIPSDAGWLSVTPVSGEVPAGQNVTLNFRVNRSGLAVGIYQTTVRITAGSQEISLPISMEVSALQVTPNEMQFGLIEQQAQQIIKVSNLGTQQVSIQIGVSQDAQLWLSVQNPQFNIPPAQSIDVPVIVNPANLPANDYSGTLQIRDTTTNYAITVNVRMRTRALTVNPALINFGKIREIQTQTFTINNSAPVAWRWTSDIPDTSNWLKITPTTGNIDAGGTQTITVEANPTILQPGEYQGNITINSSWGSSVINVQMEASRAPKLVVLPTQINFGETRAEETLALWNDGEETIAWEIDTTQFPSWLSIIPVNNQGIASGQVSGSQTATLKVKVNRALANESEGPSYQYSFNVKGTVVQSSTNLTPVTVQTSMSVPQIPEVTIVGEGTDNNGIPVLNFAIEENEQEFVIQNTGKGTLEWKIVTTDIPGWITSINPTQGALGKGKEQKIKVAVSRDTLTYLGDVYELFIQTSDPENPVVKIIIEIQVPKKVIIGAQPGALNFGPGEILKTFDVANLGDPGTALDFLLIPNKEWISVFPESGLSYGIEGPIKEWKEISVSIDREGLDGANSSGQIKIIGRKTVNGVKVIDETVTPIFITITASAPTLTVETAPPNLRIPSLMRYVMTLRDVQQRAISLPEAFLPTLADKFIITEDDLPLDIQESSRFLIPMVKSERLVQHKGTILILLDASGSMFQSASSLEEQEIAGANDPIRELYIRTLPAFIDDIPDNYQIGIGIFNEREWFGSSVRMLVNNDGEPIFTFNKDIVKNRLLSMDIIDHGATALLPAITSGALEMLDADGDHIPFDVSDDRIMLVITDGKLTTPPGQISPVVDFLKGSRVRPFFLCWGENVNKNILVQLIEETGGHLYSTRNKITESVDNVGKPISKPLFSTLADWLETDSNDPCDRSIAKDIQSQLLFEFVALNQMSGATVKIDLAFNSPSDDGSPCLLDQGAISTAFGHTQIDLLKYANDVRLGQIKLRTDGIDTNSQTVDIVVYADYIQRNINSLQFSVGSVGGNPSMTMSVRQPTFAEGGLIPDWNFNQLGSILQFTSPNNQPLDYGAFGSLCVLHFENVTQPFQLQFDVVFPQITANAESKYFTHPNLFDVKEQPNLAPSNPYPRLETQPTMDANYVITLPDDTYDLVVNIYNDGGSHRPTSVGLYWDVEALTGEFFGNIVKPDEEDRIIYENGIPYELHIPIERGELLPGTYQGILHFSFDSIFNNPIERFVYVYCTILPPEITVIPTVLNFNSPNTVEGQSFIIRNTGQSTLSWSFDRASLPASGYTFSKLAGSVAPYAGGGTEDVVTITVNKTQIDVFNPIIPIISNAVNGTVNLVLNVSK
ncbi:MAG: BACON domain-containing protein [Candidatus Hydrogenedens sp.]